MTETDTLATAAAATPAAEEATDLAALAELTAQRSAVYRLLARLYRVEVDEEFLAELQAMRLHLLALAESCPGDDSAECPIIDNLSGCCHHKAKA